MRVGEFKRLLSEVDDRALVVMSKDGEGNDYSPLSGHSTKYHYNADSAWSGELTSEERCVEERAEDGLEGPCDHTDCRYGEGVPALVLWPAN